MMARAGSKTGISSTFAILFAAAALIAGCGSQSPSSSAGSSSGSPGSSSGSSGSSSSGSAAPSTSTRAASPSAPSGTGSSATRPAPSAAPRLPAGYLPLWPFPGSAAVSGWQAGYRSGGHQPWHLDAGVTALSFTRSYLGYTEIDRVTSRSLGSGSALIGVGYLDPNRKPVTVAVLHLLRYGSATDAPWEVVGTRDTRLTLSTPRYGATVGSPVLVGGRITGVDENLVVLVHGLSSSRPLGRSAGLPAGGENQPWRTTVSFGRCTDRVLTIAVSTGGHLAGVEAFAITGVRVPQVATEAE